MLNITPFLIWNIKVFNLCRFQSSGFQATLEIRENLENEFPSFQSGKIQRIWEKHKKSGETQGICDSDPEGKGFHHFGVCASCADTALNHHSLTFQVVFID